MNPPLSTFPNNSEAAHAIKDFLLARGISPNGFALRPHNMYSPEFSYWWFVPSSDWPAFKHSKLTIHRWPVDGPEAMYVGLFVEKGLGQQLRELPDVRQKQIMEPDWYWHEFVRRVRGNALDSSIHTLFERSRLEIVACIDVYQFNQLPQEDSEHPLTAPYDWIEFSIDPSTNQLENSHQGKTKELRSLHHCRSMAELIDVINNDRELDFYWLDVFLGVKLQYGNNTNGTWDAAKIWNEVLLPWDEWVK